MHRAPLKKSSMKYFLAPVFALLIAIPVSAQQVRSITESDVKSVKVFLNGAQVNREAKTTIDAGTRIGRFLLQETVGRVSAPFARPDWLPGAMLASAVIIR